MVLRHLACGMMLTLSLGGVAYGSVSVPQTFSSDMVSASSNEAVNMTGTKIITDDFSFTVPKKWAGECVMVQNDCALELYDKASYEEDESGFLLSITRYTDDSYTSLTKYSVLGYCGNDTFVLNTSASGYESKNIKKAMKEIQESFVAFAGAEEYE